LKTTKAIDMSASHFAMSLMGQTGAMHKILAETHFNPCKKYENLGF
jgi:hypothetical protein